jgi:hypothetical protein
LAFDQPPGVLRSLAAKQPIRLSFASAIMVPGGMTLKLRPRPYDRRKPSSVASLTIINSLFALASLVVLPPVPELVGWQGTKALLNDDAFISPLVGYFKQNFLNKTKCRLTKKCFHTSEASEYAGLKTKRKRQCAAKKLKLAN